MSRRWGLVLGGGGAIGANVMDVTRRRAVLDIAMRTTTMELQEPEELPALMEQLADEPVPGTGVPDALLDERAV